MKGVLSLSIQILSLLPAANAFWRLGCPSTLVVERADPIVDPGVVSAHVHTVAGGSAFTFDMNYTQARKSVCSSCEVKQDLSNYWVPQLYFHDKKNGSFIRVPTSGTYAGLVGGMTVYYLQRGGPNNDKLHAFPEGFRMTAGNPFKRSFSNDFAGQAISYMCLDYTGGSTQSNGFPNKNCPQGLRAQVFFPSCWDGKNLDSPDHQSHVSYPSSWSFDSGPCPASHPVHLVSIFYEVIFETNNFANQWDGSQQPFVWAQGDPTGYGLHGDFLNGWDVPTLQTAVDHCLDNSGVIEKCPYFDFFSWDSSQACHIPPEVSEDVDGPMAQLPGCNPIQNGPQMATDLSSTCKNTPAIAEPKYYTDVTKTLGWEYVGCGTDNVADRTFPGTWGYNTTETIEKCVEYCAAQGHTYAGAEYGTQCYCGNSLRSDRAPVAGIMGDCTMKCGGASNQYCGGAAAMSIYKKCSSASNCKNAQFTPVKAKRRVGFSERRAKN